MVLRRRRFLSRGERTPSIAAPGWTSVLAPPVSAAIATMLAEWFPDRYIATPDWVRPAEVLAVTFLAQQLISHGSKELMSPHSLRGRLWEAAARTRAELNNTTIMNSHGHQTHSQRVHVAALEQGKLLGQRPYDPLDLWRPLDPMCFRGYLSDPAHRCLRDHVQSYGPIVVDSQDSRTTWLVVLNRARRFGIDLTIINSGPTGIDQARSLLKPSSGAGIGADFAIVADMDLYYLHRDHPGGRDDYRWVAPVGSPSTVVCTAPNPTHGPLMLYYVRGTPGEHIAATRPAWLGSREFETRAVPLEDMRPIFETMARGDLLATWLNTKYASRRSRQSLEFCQAPPEDVAGLSLYSHRYYCSANPSLVSAFLELLTAAWNSCRLDMMSSTIEAMVNHRAATSLEAVSRRGY